MALLQISEPGQSAAPHQHRLAAGIEAEDVHLVFPVVILAGRAVADHEVCRERMLWQTPRRSFAWNMDVRWRWGRSDAGR